MTKRLQFSKLKRLIKKVLTGIKPFDYTKPMMEPETKMHPKVYEDIKNRYDEASRLRREEIRRLARDGWSQREIAKYYKTSISRVNKIIKGEGDD